jgi:YaaC-like Protein
MGFMIKLPLKGKEIAQLNTSGKITNQIWQELEMLRHLKAAKHLYAQKSIAPWIDQARTYFQDGEKSNWRSAGLLYYYSFLNLAKAYLVAKRKFTYKSLDTDSVYHGLSANLQGVKSIVDYQIHIHPPQMRNKRNVFSSLYEVVVDDIWPFPKDIAIKLSDFVTYCQDIGSEISTLHGLKTIPSFVESLVRVRDEKWFFEMAGEDRVIQILQDYLPSLPMQVLSQKDMEQDDQNAWLWAYNRKVAYFDNYKLLRTSLYKEDEFSVVFSKIHDDLKHVAFMPPQFNLSAPCWVFVPEIELVGQKLKWHPMLSDYLFSFVISTILRYQPQLLSSQSADSLLAAAWCSQASITTLRYFLMFFTKPSIILTSNN